MNGRFKRNFRRLAWAGCLVLAPGLFGCGPMSDTQQQSQNDDSAIRELIANDRQQIEQLQEQVSRANDRITELEHNGGGASAGSNKLASLDKRVSKLEAPLAPAAPGGAGAVAPGAPADAGAATGTNVSAATGEGEGSEEGEETASAAPPAAPAPPAVAPPPVGVQSWRGTIDQELATSYDDPAAKLYRAGLVDTKAGRYPQAVAKFESLQHRYPKSDLSEPAEYFSANALYEMGKYEQAVLQFNDLTQRFPKGKFASAALWQEAQAFMKINDRIDAQLTLQKLLDDHPDSPEAPSAKSMMQTLAS
jgi:TolA-binding protein